jgi:AraC-like DNA-binding protein
VVPRLAAAFLRQIGAPAERLVEGAGLSVRSLEHPESLVPFHAVVRLLEDAARVEGIEDLGLRFGATSRVTQLGTFGRLIGRSFTLREGLTTAHRLLPSYSSGERAWLEQERGEVRLHHLLLGSAESRRQATGLSLMLHLNFIRSAAGASWRPTEVGIPAGDLPGWRALPLLSDTRLVFGRPHMTIVFSPDVLPLALPRAAAPAGPEVVPWQHSGPAEDVSGAVRQVVAALLPAGYPDVRLVAESVRMSARTLQRRLHAEGMTFARVVARARHDAALRLLDDPARKVIDVALDLGYSDPAHFTRAFSRWTGVTPREFRRLRSTDRPQAAAR